jgi:hypothetical protein
VRGARDGEQHPQNCANSIAAASSHRHGLLSGHTALRFAAQYWIADAAASVALQTESQSRLPVLLSDASTWQK